MNNEPAIHNDVWLVYDGECPVCTAYTQYIRIRKTVGRLHLIDARHASPLMAEITQAGLDIDHGMVVKVKDALYYGPDAIHILTLLGSPSDLFNRINFYCFRTRTGARILYPIAKTCRLILLKLLGISYIDNLNKNQNLR